MTSYLMHLDTPVAEIAVESGKISHLTRIINRSLMPIGCIGDNLEVKRQSLQNWQEMRAIPKDRQKIEKILSFFGVESPVEAYEFSNGVSLTDTYWFKPINLSTKD